MPKNAAVCSAGKVAPPRCTENSFGVFRLINDEFAACSDEHLDAAFDFYSHLSKIRSRFAIAVCD